jgi:polysaccharide export outer membrane protein
LRLLQSTAVVWLSAVALSGAACASSSGNYVWVDSYTPPPSSTNAGTIGVGDMLDIRVLGQDQLSARTPVRSDGFIKMPFLNDIEAAGRTTSELSSQVEELLTDYVRSPVVTIGVDKAPPAPVSALGEVSRPGKYDWVPDLGIVDMLALVGGLTEYAHKDRLYVLRGRPDTVRIRFDVRDLMQGEGRGYSFTMLPGDVIVAE